ncbi:MAG TPA: ThiF family adenylyltransferase [Chloroflexota bacterium]|nr:ThiF family adenylyltransferase [Chloroflexota bacterium]HUM67331.1 ThiF family adenylyltransferase [Chloroflexota bacterium]
MQALNMEQTYRVLLGDVNGFRIMLVGCGGTGSSLALALAGLAYHAQQKGIEVELTLVDPDHVDYANPGRQIFTPLEASAGVAKCCALALRLNAAYGLSITAWPERYEAGLASEWFNHRAGGCSQPHLIIGAVDNTAGRREIAKTVDAYHGRVWALDSGNDRWSGQVLIGNLTDVSQIKLDRLGLCTGLPSPYVQEPDLLEPDPEEENQSCAEMALAETQSLMVNRMAAAIAAQYVATFVLQKQILQLGSYFNLDPPTARSRLITRANINQYQKERVTSNVT